MSLVVVIFVTSTNFLLNYFPIHPDFWECYLRYIRLTLWWKCTLNYGGNYFWIFCEINLKIHYWIEPSWRPRGVSGFFECYLGFIEPTLRWTRTLNFVKINYWKCDKTRFSIEPSRRPRGACEYYFSVWNSSLVSTRGLFIADCFFFVYCKSILWISHV